MLMGIKLWGMRRRHVLRALPLLLLTVFVGASSQAQSVQKEPYVNLNVTNAKLSTVLENLRKQSGFGFVYSNDIIVNQPGITASVERKTLSEALSIVLEKMPLTFSIDNKVVYITKKAGGDKIAAGNNQETRKIKGVVTDEAGAPLHAVSVVDVATGKGVSTNDKGFYELTMGANDSRVSFSFVGRVPKTIAVKDHPTGIIDVQLLLQEDVASEVVVTGFQKIEKKKFTGAAAKVTMDDIKQDGVMDVARMLEGRVAGVTVENVSGTFGAAPKIHIRGATSISGMNKPLWVVDGIVLEDIVSITNDELASGDPTTMLGSSVAGINVNDIESFDILKDASATALYGARAMNGVIVITTKKGRAGKTQINYSGTFSSVLKPTYRKYNIMNSAQQMGVDMELYDKGWLNFSDVSRSINGGVFAKAADLVSTYDPATGKFGLANNPDSISAFLMRYAGANTDWFNVLFRNSFTQEHNLSMSYGTDKAQSYFSTNFYQDNGWTIGDKVNRYTINFNNTYTPNKKLNLGFNATASYRQQVAPGTVDRVSNKVTGGFDRDFDINPFNYALTTSRVITPYDENGNLEYFRKNFAPFNIINELKNNTLHVNVLDVKLQGQLGYKITNDLKFEFTGALRVVQTSLEHEITENSNMAEAYRADQSSYVRDNNKFLYKDPDHPNDQPVVVLPKGGLYNRTDNKMLNYSVRNILTYTKNFNKDNYLNVLGGMEIKATDRRVSNFTGYGYQYDGGGIPFVDPKALKQLEEANFNYYGMGNTKDRFVAFFGNATYSYKRRYTLNATVREDGSNSLGKSSKSRWLPTWTVGGAWNAYSEPSLHSFISAAKISQLNLRGSYGLSADFGAANNSSVILKTQTTTRPTQAEQEAGISLISLENSDLTWEKKYEANIGLDVGFFRDRLTITTDIYNRNSFDLISMIPTAGIGGQIMKAANYADLKSRGIEVTVGGKIIQHKNFRWQANLTFGYNTTKITNLKNQPQINDLVSAQGGSQVGYPVRAIFSIPFAGLDPASGIPVFINQAGNTSADVFLQSTNTGNLKYEGSADPLYTGGLTNIFTYKAFSLNMLFVYQAGNRVRLSPVFSANYSDLNAMPKDFINRWEAPGDEKITNIPSISDRRAVYMLNTASPYANYNMSDLRVANGGFVRLKTVAVTYRIPEQFTSAIGLSTSSVTLTGNNLWLLFADKKLKGQDPEFANSGGVGSPVFTQLALALKVGF